MKPAYEFVTKSDMDMIHEYSMRLLEKNGVSFMGQGALDVFKAHGFKVEGETVFMTEEDVRKALETTPKTFAWYGKKGKVVIGEEQVLTPSYGPIFALEDGEYHEITLEDYLNFAKLTATSDVLNASNPNMLDFSFIPKEHRTNWAMATILMHDERPAIGMVDGTKSASDSIQMVQDFYGIYDRVFVNSLISVASPCHYSESMCEALIEYSQRGQAMFITPAALHGLTSPGSIASLLMLNNAEVLAGVVLTQLINPGVPVMYGIQSHGCDMRYSTPNTGSPEQFLIFYAAKAMGAYYDLPVRTGGTCSDAKDDDMQAGCESFSSMYASMISGTDLIVHALGNMDSDNSISYDKFIFDEDVVRSIKRIQQGITVNEDTMMFDALLDAGPGGNFLQLSGNLIADSFMHYKKEYVMLPTFCHEGHAQWLNNGRISVTDRAKQIRKQRIEEYKMPELTADGLAVLKKFVPEDLLALSMEK